MGGVSPCGRHPASRTGTPLVDGRRLRLSVPSLLSAPLAATAAGRSSPATARAPLHLEPGRVYPVGVKHAAYFEGSLVDGPRARVAWPPGSGTLGPTAQVSGLSACRPARQLSCSYLQRQLL
jgi:hypothetical protein